MIDKIFKKDIRLDRINYIYLLLLIFVFGGIFGFIYEEIFYRIDLGYFVKRGTTFGPWIPIYGFGGLFVTLFIYRFKKNPVVVFLLSCLITGLLEFITGYVCYHFLGIRLWDYNTEILNFGNIGGYVCLRSILFFGVSSTLLVYVFIPIFKYIINNLMVKRTALVLCSLFVLDIVVSLIV